VKFRRWLKREVIRLQEEIAEHPVFLTDDPASRDDLQHLRKLVTVHRFLQQQLHGVDFDTLETGLVGDDVEAAAGR
jgi:hypothetical protein